MSEIEKALREWVEKQEAVANAEAFQAETKNAMDGAICFLGQAQNAERYAMTAALRAIPIGAKFPIVVGEYVVSKVNGSFQAEKATVIGEAKPKADLQGDLIAGFPVGAKFLAHQKFEVVRNYPNGLIDAMSGGFLRTFYPHETGTPILE